VLNSPHNLSASGKGTYHSVLEQRVCIFCHAPHNARSGTPLWNRDPSSDSVYAPYKGSSTLKASVSHLPTGASRRCLSCHDGTIALGSFRGSAATDLAALPTGTRTYMSDLSADHPISFVYDVNLVAQKKNEVASPQQLPAQIRLDADGNLQCTTCHDPHDNMFGNFLVMSNRESGSPLCKACHTYPGWGPGANPHYDATRPRSDADSTKVTGCENCHVSHKAPMPVRLLDYVNEEDNCIKYCHNSSGDQFGPRRERGAPGDHLPRGVR
jgi:predicted CXXCH cytochrome family protein